MTKLNVSPSRTYVIPLYNGDFSSIYFKKFTLPEDEENTCEFATWYFYNRLDYFSCGKEAYPIEMHNNIVNAESPNKRENNEKIGKTYSLPYDKLNDLNIVDDFHNSANGYNISERHIKEFIADGLEEVRKEAKLGTETIYKDIATGNVTVFISAYRQDNGLYTVIIRYTKKTEIDVNFD